jgi:hypothetical protein
MSANGPSILGPPANLDAATVGAGPLLGAGALEAPPITWPGHCSSALATSAFSNQLLLLVRCLDVTVFGSPKLECMRGAQESHPGTPSFVRR